MTTPDEGYETRSSKRKILGIGILLVLLAATLALSFWPKNSAIVRNSTNGELKNITLELVSTSPQDDWRLAKTFASLTAGESSRLRHRKNEARATLRFEKDGQQFEYHEEHIDYWQGEGWVFDIQQDGSVKGGYGQ